MKVALLSKMFPPSIGGAETYAKNIAYSIGRMGHEVDVYTQSYGEKGKQDECGDNVSIMRIASRKRGLVTFETIYYSLKALLRVDFRKYDIVHGTLMPSSTFLVAPYIKKRDSTPLVLTSHGTSLDECRSIDPISITDYAFKYFFHPMNYVMDNITARYADMILANSKNTYERLNNEYNIKEDILELVPMGVDVTKFSENTDGYDAFDDDLVTISYLGRLGPRKGLERAIKSFAKMDNEDKELVIGGKGRMKEYLQKKVDTLGLTEKVKFIGHVKSKNIASFYAGSDIFLMPSNYEGFGLVILEAMASGTPVISTYCGGAETIIDHNVDGLLVRKNSDCLSGAIMRLSNDEQLRKQMSNKALKKAHMNSWNEVAKRTVKQYKKVT